MPIKPTKLVERYVSQTRHMATARHALRYISSHNPKISHLVEEFHCDICAKEREVFKQKKGKNNHYYSCYKRWLRTYNGDCATLYLELLPQALSAIPSLPPLYWDLCWSILSKPLATIDDLNNIKEDLHATLEEKAYTREASTGKLKYRRLYATPQNIALINSSDFFTLRLVLYREHKLYPTLDKYWKQNEKDIIFSCLRLVSSYPLRHVAPRMIKALYFFLEINDPHAEGINDLSSIIKNMEADHCLQALFRRVIPDPTPLPRTPSTLDHYLESHDILTEKVKLYCKEKGYSSYEQATHLVYWVDSLSDNWLYGDIERSAMFEESSPSFNLLKEKIDYFLSNNSFVIIW